MQAARHATGRPSCRGVPMMPAPLCPLVMLATLGTLRCPSRRRLPRPGARTAAARPSEENGGPFYLNNAQGAIGERRRVKAAAAFTDNLPRGNLSVIAGRKRGTTNHAAIALGHAHRAKCNLVSVLTNRTARICLARRCARCAATRRAARRYPPPAKRKRVRAARGHAAAPPSSVMNSRRLVFAIIRSPRRRGRARAPAGRAPTPSRF